MLAPTIDAPRFDAAFAPDAALADRAEAASWTEVLRTSKGLIALSMLILATLWGAIAYQVGRDRDQALLHSQVNLVNLVRAFAEHTSKTLEGADQAVKFVRAEYQDHGKDLDIGSYLNEKQIIGPEYNQMAIIGADGFVTHSSLPFQRVDLRDRAHFRVHAEGHEDTLYISKPVLGRVSGKWSIQLTRRIDTPQGQFGGVTVLSLSPDYLTRFYADVDLGRHGAITLAGFDGIVRARATQDGSVGAQDLSKSPLFRDFMIRRIGTARAISTIDNVDRIWAFRALDRYGLMVVAGTGVDDMMAEPRQRARAYVVGAGVLSIVIAAFVVGLLRRARQQLTLVRQLEHTTEEAQAANRLKTRFLASVSHELRTPLNGILGYAELIRDGATASEARDYGDTIHRSAEQLHGLVNAILDLAKIESGRLEVTLADTPLDPLLGEVQRLHAAHAQQRGLALLLEPGAGERLCAVADRQRLLQVLDNVVDNAVKFTDQGTVRIRAARRGGRIEIEVEDTGIGIPEARLSTIFARFQSASADFTHAAQGAGLGLSLSSELMALMGGSIRIASTPGRGTTVTLDLPATEPSTDSPP